MNLPTRAQPRALVACFGVAMVLGLGFGFVVGDMKQSRATPRRSGAISPTDRAPNPDRTVSTLPPSTAPAPPLGIVCSVQGARVPFEAPTFVAGVADGGSDHLADAFNMPVKQRLSVRRDALNDDAQRDRFQQSVVDLRATGPGVLLVQQGRRQLQIAQLVAKEGVVVVVVFPNIERAKPMTDYPRGTLGVFSSETDERSAALTPPEAADVVRVLRNGVPCAGEPVEKENR